MEHQDVEFILHPAWMILPAGRELGVTSENLGLIPTFLYLDDPRPAAAQINKRYNHGGGWRPGNYFSMESPAVLISKYGDDPLFPLACTMLRNETIYYYDFSWVAIVQPDGSFETARLD